VEKESVFQVQVGVNYDNKETVKQGRADGTLPEENAGLPWGNWLIFPYVIEHKGNLYFRFYPVKNNFVPSVRYFMDGREVTKAEVEPLCLASEFADKGEVLCFTYPLEGILEAK